MKSVSALMITLLLQVLQVHTQTDDTLEVKAHQGQHFTLTMLRDRHVNDKEQRKYKKSLSNMEIFKNKFLSQLVQSITSRTKLISVVKNYFSKSVKHQERNESQKGENNLKKINKRVEKKKNVGLHKFCRYRFGKVCQMIPKHNIYG